MFSEFLKYNTIGIVNTVVGFSIIIVLMMGGLSPLTSNAVGYGIGAILSYYLNSKFTFKAKDRHIKQAILFFIVLFIAYIFNVLTLKHLLNYFSPYMAQIGAAAVHTVSSFLLMKIFVFRNVNSKTAKQV